MFVWQVFATQIILHSRVARPDCLCDFAFDRHCRSDRDFCGNTRTGTAAIPTILDSNKTTLFALAARQ
jgi:hypothetical protein